MDAARASMLEILAFVEGELAGGAQAVELDVLDPDVARGRYAGETVTLELDPDVARGRHAGEAVTVCEPAAMTAGQAVTVGEPSAMTASADQRTSNAAAASSADAALIHRPWRTWLDLAERLGLRMCTPRATTTSRVRLRFERLDRSTQVRGGSAGTEKYGTRTDFARIHKLEDPGFVVDVRDALERVIAARQKREAVERDIPATQPRDIPAAQQRDIPAAQPRDIPAAQPRDISAAQPRDISAAQPRDISAAQPRDIPAAQPRDIPAAQPSDIPAAQPRDIPAAQPRDVPATPARVLYLGCNTGDEIALVRATCPALADASHIGVDHSASAIAAARARFASEPRISFYEADLATAAPALGRFDLIVAIGTLQSPDIDDRQLLRTLVQDHLSPHGAILLGLPNCRYVDGEIEYGTRMKNFRQPELGLLLKDVAFYRKYLQQHHKQVFVTGKHYLLVTAVHAAGE